MVIIYYPKVAYTKVEMLYSNRATHNNIKYLLISVIHWLKDIEVLLKTFKAGTEININILKIFVISPKKILRKLLVEDLSGNGIPLISVICK